jgi:hypothetical protein
LSFSLSRNEHFMNKFAKHIRPFVSLEIAAAAEADGDSASFMHLQRAHVLGQASTREHVRVHFRMLVWALRHRRAREVSGQVFRLLGAATLTAIGMVPAGNTGGTNVSPFQKMAVAPDLAILITMAQR